MLQLHGLDATTCEEPQPSLWHGGNGREVGHLLSQAFNCPKYPWSNWKVSLGYVDNIVIGSGSRPRDKGPFSYTTGSGTRTCHGGHVYMEAFTPDYFTEIRKWCLYDPIGESDPMSSLPTQKPKTQVSKSVCVLYIYIYTHTIFLINILILSISHVVFPILFFSNHISNLKISKLSLILRRCHWLHCWTHRYLFHISLPSIVSSIILPY